MSHSEGCTIDWPAALAEHRPWMEKVLQSRICDRHEVHDLLQEIALKVVQQAAGGIDKAEYENADSEKPAGRPASASGLPSQPECIAPWLYCLTIRQAANFHRRRGRKSQAHPVEQIETPATTADPLDRLVAAEQSDRLSQAVAKLAPMEREILTLKYTQNWTYQQLSDHLGVPVRSIEYRLLNARNHLRKLMFEN